MSLQYVADSIPLRFLGCSRYQIHSPLALNGSRIKMKVITLHRPFIFDLPFGVTNLLLTYDRPFHTLKLLRGEGNIVFHTSRKRLDIHI